MDVIFGGVLVLAFEALYQTINKIVDPWTTGDLAPLFAQIAIALALFTFFLYDVGTWHLLVELFPHRLNRRGSFRYLLDIVMAFLLMLVVIPGMEFSRASAVVMVFALSSWHAAAMVWHVLARWEVDDAPNRQKWLPHLIAIASYCLTVGVIHLYSRINGLPFKNFALFLSICLLMFLFALRRLSQMVSFYQESQVGITVD